MKHQILSKKSPKYCFKCLKRLEDSRFGKFCSSSCRKEYYLEVRQDREDIYNEFFSGSED